MDVASDSGSATLVADAPDSTIETPAAEAERPTGESRSTPSPADAETQSDSGDAADVAQPSPDAPAEPAPDLNSYPAFSYEGGGEHHEFAGTHQDSDGNVLFTPQAVQRLKHQLAYAHAYPKRDAEARRSEARISKRAEAAEASLSKVLQTFDEMFERGTWQQWAENQGQNWKVLRAEAERHGLEIKSSADREELDRLRQEQTDVQQRPQQMNRVEEAIRHWGSQGGLSEAEQAQLVKKWQGRLDTVFPRAEKDDPGTGTKAGTRTENLEGIREEILFLHNILKGRTPAQAKADVVKENATRQGQGGVKPPPVASVGKGTKPAPQKPKEYKSTRDADKDIWS